MAESTLSLTYDDLAKSTAFYLGYQRRASTADGLSSAQEANVIAANNAGYRKFLSAFEWSFLYPSVSAVLFGTVTGTASATTTTVTATVAKFFPTMIGKELLIDVVVNGTFAADTDWTKGAGWTIGSGVATATGAISTDLSQTVNPLIVGNTYRVTFTVSRTAGSITSVCGAASGTARSTNGTFTEDIVCTTSTGFKFSTSGFTGTIDNVTVETVLVITAYTSSTVVTVSGSGGTITSKPFEITPDGAYRLADDFGGVYGDRIRFSNDEGWVRQMTITSEGIVGGLLQGSTSSARPERVGFRPLTTDGTTGQRFEILVWPIPDANYTVRFRQLINPDALLTGKYPYGGLNHAETLRLACTSAAESMFHEGPGPEEAKYQLALANSIRRDQRSIRAATVGIAGDSEPQDEYHDYYSGIDSVTVSGVSYN